MPPLEPARRRALRARAHHLDPVVTIGHHGLTPAVLHEIDVALAAHELVKVRVLGDDRAAREGLLSSICRELDCAPVQQIGKLLVVWRPRPAEAAPEQAAAKRAHAPARAMASRSAAAKGGAAAPADRDSRLEPRTSPVSRPGRAPRKVPRAPLPRRRRGV